MEEIRVNVGSCFLDCQFDTSTNFFTLMPRIRNLVRIVSLHAGPEIKKVFQGTEIKLVIKQNKIRYLKHKDKKYYMHKYACVNDLLMILIYVSEEIITPYHQEWYFWSDLSWDRVELRIGDTHFSKSISLSLSDQALAEEIRLVSKNLDK